ncbi:MAG: FmdB family zinc ribbon protein [Treponemataceae bacterium]
MPYYDYACNSCRHTFEEFQKMSDKPLSECPKCKGEVKKMLSAGLGISFKGEGFYVNEKSSKKPETKSVPATPKPCDGNCKACS